MQFKNIKHLPAQSETGINQRLAMWPTFTFYTGHVVKSTFFFGLWAPNRQFLSLFKRKKIPTASSPPRILIFCFFSFHGAQEKES